VVGVLACTVGRRAVDAGVVMAWIGGGLAGGLVTFVLSAGADRVRYALPIWLSVYGVAALRVASHARRRGLVTSLSVIALLVGFVCFRDSERDRELTVAGLRALPRRVLSAVLLVGQRVRPLPSGAWDATVPRPDDYASWRALERAQSRMVGEGSALVMVDEPFVLDFAARRLFIVDYACSASPAPGIPCDGDIDALEAYLVAQGIRYVLFTTDEMPEWILARKRQAFIAHPWRLAVNGKWKVWHDSLRALSARSSTLFAEGNLILFELKR
jgi:hypothetical protein